jgi:hypothetical protein
VSVAPFTIAKVAMGFTLIVARTKRTVVQIDTPSSQEDGTIVKMCDNKRQFRDDCLAWICLLIIDIDLPPTRGLLNRAFSPNAGTVVAGTGFRTSERLRLMGASLEMAVLHDPEFGSQMDSRQEPSLNKAFEMLGSTWI